MSKTKKKRKAGTVLFTVFSVIILAVCAFAGMTYAQCSFRPETEPADKTADFVRVTDSELQTNQNMVDTVLSNGNISDVIRSWCTANNDKKYNQYTVTVDLFVLTDAGTETTNYGNADAIFLVAQDSSKKTIDLIQIDRDMLHYADTDGGIFCKLNAAYANGGCKLLKKSIENIYKIVINRTFSVSVEGLSEITDQIGGLNVNVTTDLAAMIEEDFHVNLTIGKNDLNGTQMAYYVREKRDGRKNRNARFSEVAQALLEKVTDMNIMEKITFMKALAANCRCSASGLENAKIVLSGLTVHKKEIGNYMVPMSEDAALYKDSDWILIADMAKEAQALQTVLFDASNITLSAERQSPLEVVNAVNEAWSVDVSMSVAASVSASMENNTEKVSESENKDEEKNEDTVEEEGVVG